MSSQALAHVAGVLLLKYDEAPTELDAKDRASMKKLLEKLEKNYSGYVTVWHKWMLMHVDDADASFLWKEVKDQWLRSPRTTFSDFLSFLSAYFNLWNDTILNVHGLKMVVYELERVGDGLPPRYQQLFFELTEVINQYEDDVKVDLAAVKEAMELHRVVFPDMTTDMVVEGTRKKAA